MDYFHAAANGKLKVLQEQLKRDPDLASKNEGSEALAGAIYHGHRDIAELFLKAGANVNYCRPGVLSSSSLLHHAACHGNAAMVELLLAFKADVNSLCRSVAHGDMTPLYEAANRGVAELLISHGADVQQKAADGWTPLHEVADWSFVTPDRPRPGGDVAACLLSHGANPNATTSKGWTPLHVAATRAVTDWGNEDVLKALLAHGAEVNARNANGRTALDEVLSTRDERSWKRDVARFLRDQGATTANPPVEPPLPSAGEMAGALFKRGVFWVVSTLILVAIILASRACDFVTSTH